jgi:hypothetical protein
MAKKTISTLLDSIKAALSAIERIGSPDLLEEATSVEELDPIDRDLWAIHDYIEEMKNER